MNGKPTTESTLLKHSQSSGLSIPTLLSLETLTDQQLIEKLYLTIDEQQRRIEEFNLLLGTYLDRIKALSTTYDREKAYSKEVFEKMEQLRNQNYRLKVEIGLVKSDNLILKSKLGYQETKQKQIRDQPNTPNRNRNQENEDKLKKLQIKMSKVRKIVKQLMKALQKIILNNEDQENEILAEITELMQHIK